jgi:hypothetical protein
VESGSLMRHEGVAVLVHDPDELTEAGDRPAVSA